MRYEIVVAGVAGRLVREALGGFEEVGSETGRTRLAGEVEDAAALTAALQRLQDLHVDLLDVHRVD